MNKMKTFQKDQTPAFRIAFNIQGRALPSPFCDERTVSCGEDPPLEGTLALNIQARCFTDISASCEQVLSAREAREKRYPRCFKVD